MSQTLILVICGVVALGIHAVVQWREQGKSFKPDVAFYVLAAIVGGLAISGINTVVVKAVRVMGIILLTETIYRLIKRARQ